MLALYKILISDIEKDSNEIKKLKKLAYSLIYMDNGCISYNDIPTLKWAKDRLVEIFKERQFNLQQFVSNDPNLQKELDRDLEESTPQVCKLFGLLFDRVNDTLSTKPLYLNPDANTKRLVLKSIAKNFDVFNMYGPQLNRARLFMQDLQIKHKMSWDTTLENRLQNEWKNIAKQINDSEKVQLRRYIGPRDSKYRLIAFSDASKLIAGTVLYIQDVQTSQVTFLLSKNRLVNKCLEGKSIPSKELHALAMGTSVLVEIYKELTNSNLSVPISICELTIYTDSMICLNWLEAYSCKLTKLQNKCSVFVMNRLKNIVDLCEVHPVKYGFTAGKENPSDVSSRVSSPRKVLKSSFYTGPKDNLDMNESTDLFVTIPDPNNLSDEVQIDNKLTEVKTNEIEHLIPLNRFERFEKLCVVLSKAFLFINVLKLKLKNRNSNKYKHLQTFESDENFILRAKRYIISTEQKIKFSNCFNYFSKRQRNLKDIPNLIIQLNIFKDKDLLKIKSKCEKGENLSLNYTPILLPRHSELTKLIIRDIHVFSSHAGKYQVLNELRKNFWTPKNFSAVKEVLRGCILCRRLHSRTVKLNQNAYREFRINPPSIPYRYCYLDLLGHYFIIHNGVKIKSYILIITCLWSKSINLKICLDLTVKSFIRGLQLHIFEYGMMELVVSDLGSQIVQASKVISDFLKDVETQTFLNKSGIKGPTFQQYFKGNSSLGGIIESCVKSTKKMIFATIGKNVLNYTDFEYVVAQTVSLVNKRPISLKESLRENDPDESLPEIITPEILLRGNVLIDVNIDPNLQPDLVPELERDPVSLINDNYTKLRNCRENLIKNYNEQFLSTLITQSVDKKSRYRPVRHDRVNIGDVILLKEVHTKPLNYPLAIVRKIFINSIGEVTHIIAMKGATRENVKRHITAIIPLLSLSEENVGQEEPVQIVKENRPVESTSKPKRKAALKNEENRRNLIADNQL